MIESAKYAGKLVDNLLRFSQMGRAGLVRGTLDTQALVNEVIREAQRDIAPGRRVEWAVGPLAPAWADGAMLRLVWQNLIANAVKYSRGADPAVITIACTRGPASTTYTVTDNGAGFDMRYVDKLFGVFQRLHCMEEFEGTGIGLANVRRIVGRHGGQTWAVGEVRHGATFSFSLPMKAEVT